MHFDIDLDLVRVFSRQLTEADRVLDIGFGVYNY